MYVIDRLGYDPGQDVMSRRTTAKNVCACVSIQVLQTSSPSYILLASLDAARRHAFTPGVWHTPVAAAAAARVQLADIPGLGLLQDGGCGAQVGNALANFELCVLGKKWDQNRTGTKVAHNGSRLLSLRCNHCAKESTKAATNCFVCAGC